MTLTLHHANDFASTIVRIALEELELPYTLAVIDFDGGQLATPEYRRINPLGLIPALETENGPMFETAAILLWLVDRTGKLGPGPKDPDRAAFLSWLFFTSNALHTSAMAMFYPHRPAGEANTDAVQAAAHDQIQTRLGLIEGLIASQNPRWLSAQQPGVLGLYISYLARWLTALPPAPYRLDLAKFPKLRGVIAAHETLASVQRVAADEGLGTKPFTEAVL